MTSWTTASPLSLAPAEFIAPSWWTVPRLQTFYRLPLGTGMRLGLDVAGASADEEWNLAVRVVTVTAAGAESFVTAAQLAIVPARAEGVGQLQWLSSSYSHK